MKNKLTRDQLVEKLCSFFDEPLPPQPVSIPRIIKLRDKMLGVVYLEDYRKDY